MFFDVPKSHFFANLAITIIFTLFIFYPALSSFGHVLIGTEDMGFFLWLFWHTENSLQNGQNPIYASEIFYPNGAYLTTTSITPLQTLLYITLPESWGPFGKVTFLQILSYILGGIFSFALAYRFSHSFVPSLIASVIFNFSIYHFEKVIHHLNYSIAFPFLALFFICYFKFLEEPRKKQSIILLSIAILLLTLSEATVMIMATFIVFIDILCRYAKISKIEFFSPKNFLLLSGSTLLCLFIQILLFFQDAPLYLIYTCPSLPFLLACIIIFSPRLLIELERTNYFFTNFFVSLLPFFAYLIILLFHSNNSTNNIDPGTFLSYIKYSSGLEYLFLPSNFQQISSFLPISLPVHSEIGTYLGIISLLFIIFSLFSKLEKEEYYFRNLFFFCMLISYPILIILDTIIYIIPFFVQPIFPLLGVLRVPSRFIMFALLFFSIFLALIIKRITMEKPIWKFFGIIILCLLLIERWPATTLFIFDSSIPEFYQQLASLQYLTPIYLYPNFNYYILNREVYYQTIHNMPISYGILSRFPKSNNSQIVLSDVVFHELNNVSAFSMANLIKSNGYDYIVVQKTTCNMTHECFMQLSHPINETVLSKIKAKLLIYFDNPIYEDNSILVYQTKTMNRNIN